MRSMSRKEGCKKPEMVARKPIFVTRRVASRKKGCEVDKRNEILAYQGAVERTAPKAVLMVIPYRRGSCFSLSADWFVVWLLWKEDLGRENSPLNISLPRHSASGLPWQVVCGQAAGEWRGTRSGIRTANEREGSRPRVREVNSMEGAAVGPGTLRTRPPHGTLWSR